MPFLAALGLTLLHVLSALWGKLVTLFCIFSRSRPLPLEAKRPKVPKHLAVVFPLQKDASDAQIDELIQNVVNVVRWCERIAVEKLSVYDKHGVVLQHCQCIQNVLTGDAESFRSDSDELDSPSDSDNEFPPTPPSGGRVTLQAFSQNKTSETSRPSSPVNSIFAEDKNSLTADKGHTQTFGISRRRSRIGANPVCRTIKYSSVDVRIFCYDASKPFMSSMAQSLAITRQVDRKMGVADSTMSMEELDEAMQERELEPPDFAIVNEMASNNPCKNALELDGFPPWLIRLTEIHHIHAPVTGWFGVTWGNHARAGLSELDFGRALDEFAGAEMRLGK